VFEQGAAWLSSDRVVRRRFNFHKRAKPAPVTFYNYSDFHEQFLFMDQSEMILRLTLCEYLTVYN
jgi:hypothetical protein